MKTRKYAVGFSSHNDMISMDTSKPSNLQLGHISLREMNFEATGVNHNNGTN